MSMSSHSETSPGSPEISPSLRQAAVAVPIKWYERGGARSGAAATGTFADYFLSQNVPPVRAVEFAAVVGAYVLSRRSDSKATERLAATEQAASEHGIPVHHQVREHPLVTDIDPGRRWGRVRRADVGAVVASFLFPPIGVGLASGRFVEASSKKRMESRLMEAMRIPQSVKSEKDSNAGR